MRTAQIPGACLIAAALLFWVSWLLMPGVGVTDAATIFELVTAQRSSVLLSVIAQLLSAALYVPALLGITSAIQLGANRAVRWGAGVLLLGAMGSAADAIFHLLAYAMTAPGVEHGSQLPVMTFMQGPGLLLVAPLILSFFVGGAWLSVAFARLAIVPWTNVWTHAAAVGIALLGTMGATAGILSARTVGLAVLGAISVAQGWAGAALYRGRAR